MDEREPCGQACRTSCRHHAPLDDDNSIGGDRRLSHRVRRLLAPDGAVLVKTA